MTKHIVTSRFLFGLLIFIGLLPLTFKFSQQGTQFLLNTTFNYVVWGGQGTALILLLLSKQKLSKNQLIAVTVLFALVPFTFTITENGTTYFILTKYTSSILSWTIAGISCSKLFANYILAS